MKIRKYMKSDKIILGDGIEYSSDPDISGLNSNIIVIGGSGSGKTYSILEPNLLEANARNKIVVVTKRRVAEMYAMHFKEKGYQVYDLNFAEPEKSNCAYDPVFYLRKEEDITHLATALVMANERKERSNADPFWDDASISLLSAEIALTLMTKPNPTFADVLDIHNSLSISEKGTDISTSLDDIFCKVEKKAPDGLALKCWKSFREAPPKTAKSIYVSMNSTIDKIFTGSIISEIRNKEKIDFEKMATKKTVIFVTTSPVDKSLHSLANMFISQAVKELFEIAESFPDGKLPIACDLAFDDFATGCRVASFPEFISIFREKRISCVLLLQSLDQLRQMYGEYDANLIVDNCDSMVYLGGNNLETARSISLRLNAPLDEVLYMPVGTEFIFRRGSLPLHSKRYHITQNIEYQKLLRQYEKQVSDRQMAEREEG